MRRRTTVWRLIYEDPDGKQEWVDQHIYHHSQYWFVGASQWLVDGLLQFWTQWEHRQWQQWTHEQQDGPPDDVAVLNAEEVLDMETTSPPPAAPPAAAPQDDEEISDIDLSPPSAAPPAAKAARTAGDGHLHATGHDHPQDDVTRLEAAMASLTLPCMRSSGSSERYNPYCR